MKINKLVFVGIIILHIVPIRAQQLFFKKQRVDTIKIESNESSYCFDKKSTTKGEKDSYVIIYCKENDRYFVDNYKKEVFIKTNNPESLKVKEKKISKYKSKVVNEGSLDSLLNGLKKDNEKHPTFNNLGLSKQQFYELTSEKHFLRIAKKNGIDWKIESPEDCKKKIQGCQQVDTFNLFLSIYFNESSLNSYSLVSDYSSVLTTKIITTDSSYTFVSSYPNLCKQPWYNSFDIERIGILNFDINKSLLGILPNDFLGINALKMETLLSEYVKWYIDKR